MGGVRGIVLDSSVLLLTSDDDNAAPALRPEASYLLRKLRYSNIPTALTHRHGISTAKAYLLQETAKISSYNYFVFNLSPEEDLSSELARVWEDNDDGTFIHVVSNCKQDLVHTRSSSCWFKVIVDAEYFGTTGMSDVFHIGKLQELPLLICQLNKKAMSKDAMIVGYVMKPSREEDFAKRGAFPLRPTGNGLIFLPLNYDLPISSQLQQVDAVLHKATDEILSVDMSGSLKLSNSVNFTKNLQELQRCITYLPDCCLIDPLNNIFPILDRLKIQQILIGLETLSHQSSHKIRAPHFLKVNSFDEPNLEQRLAEAKLSVPNIVKPQVACGVADAHSMAIVFNVNDYQDLSVPLPAVVQEYVDHSSVLYKFYVLGSKIFHAVKKSIPNADTLISLSGENSLKPLLFDSLKSLPIAKEQVDSSHHQIDIELVTNAAEWLRRTLNLTIFGFDVVVQEDTGDHVIVDVNYLPSFKEVPDNVAIPAFWDALKEKIVSGKSKPATEAS